ncbi:MAG TPA: hypothetical protein VF168_04245 [Trueperaceae bacterium]
MPREKPPPPRRDHPDYDPEPPPRDQLGDDNPKVNEYDPPRNRNASSVAVFTTVIVVLVLAVAYFLLRG